MKVLKTNKKLFTWLGICLIDDKTNHHKQLVYKLFGWLAVLILGTIILSSSLRTIDYGITDLYNALYAAFPAVEALRVSMSFISMIVLREKITLFFVNLQKFHDQSK